MISVYREADPCRSADEDIKWLGQLAAQQGKSRAEEEGGEVKGA
jgi:hypothetical protein